MALNAREEEFITTEREDRLIRLLREVETGEMLVLVADGKPVVIKESRKVMEL